jgi:ABC-2 type transport system permease protein
MFTLGISFILSAVAVFFHDIIDMYQIFLPPWLYATPIIYPINIIPKKYVPFLKLNPFYYLVECFRLPIYQGEIPELQTVFLAFLVAAVTLGIGYKVFAHLADAFVYYV